MFIWIYVSVLRYLHFFCIHITISMHKCVYMYKIMVGWLSVCMYVCMYVCIMYICLPCCFWKLMYIMTTRSFQVDIICVCLRSRMYEHDDLTHDFVNLLTYLHTYILTNIFTNSLFSLYAYICDDPCYLIWYHLACCIHHHHLLLLWPVWVYCDEQGCF